MRIVLSIVMSFFALSSFANSLLQKTLFSHPITNTQNIQPDPHVLQLALAAYQCATLQGQNKQSTLTIVDYSKPADQKRMWILDVPHNKWLFNTFVAHGKGSGNGVSSSFFSDQPQTHASSLGLFLTGNPYLGHNGYSLRLYGMEQSFNDTALTRDIVVHGASYVSDSRARMGRMGRSWGCPAVPKELAKPIIDTIKGGSVVFAYYPNARWLNQSPYLHCSSNLLNNRSVAMNSSADKRLG